MRIFNIPITKDELNLLIEGKQIQWTQNGNLFIVGVTQ